MIARSAYTSFTARRPDTLAPLPLRLLGSAAIAIVGLAYLGWWDANGEAMLLAYLDTHDGVIALREALAA